MLFRSAAEIHGNRSLRQRLDALEGFKKGTYRILVATDIAARGIDVTGIEVVLNYDLPNDPADYVHRIGRTARAGRAGRAISFACPDQQSEIRNIERLIRTSIPRKALPQSIATPAQTVVEHKEPSSKHSQQHRGRRQPRGNFRYRNRSRR